MNPSKYRANQPASPAPKQQAGPQHQARPKKKGPSVLGIVISDIKRLFLIVDEARKEPDDSWENWEGQL